MIPLVPVCDWMCIALFVLATLLGLPAVPFGFMALKIRRKFEVKRRNVMMFFVTYIVLTLLSAGVSVWQASLYYGTVLSWAALGWTLVMVNMCSVLSYKFIILERKHQMGTVYLVSSAADCQEPGHSKRKKLIQHKASPPLQTPVVQKGEYYSKKPVEHTKQRHLAVSYWTTDENIKTVANQTVTRKSKEVTQKSVQKEIGHAKDSCNEVVSCDPRKEQEESFSYLLSLSNSEGEMNFNYMEECQVSASTHNKELPSSDLKRGDSELNIQMSRLSHSKQENKDSDHLDTWNQDSIYLHIEGEQASLDLEGVEETEGYDLIEGKDWDSGVLKCQPVLPDFKPEREDSEDEIFKPLHSEEEKQEVEHFDTESRISSFISAVPCERVAQSSLKKQTHTLVSRESDSEKVKKVLDQVEANYKAWPIQRVSKSEIVLEICPKRTEGSDNHTVRKDPASGVLHHEKEKTEKSNQTKQENDGCVHDIETMECQLLLPERKEESESSEETEIIEYDTEALQLCTSSMESGTSFKKSSEKSESQVNVPEFSSQGFNHKKSLDCKQRHSSEENSPVIQQVMPEFIYLSAKDPSQITQLVNDWDEACLETARDSSSVNYVGSSNEFLDNLKEEEEENNISANLYVHKREPVESSKLTIDKEQSFRAKKKKVPTATLR